jgi:ER-bound oxygenase mpaB/B'/Rubber oxygenase, catalytic domain
MNISIAERDAMIAAQAGQVPSIYGRVDFSITPERFAAEPDAVTELGPEFSARRPALLANAELVAQLKAYTMHGDPVADAYASLSPQYGFHQLIVMLEEACNRGVENVPSAPPELVRFLREMHQFPAWLDREMIEEGARIERNAYAHRAPFVIRGGLLGTFMNKYSALPMVLTGSLSNKTAGRRVHETATFFTTTVMPDVLNPRGACFKSAAMVRLMHSMVRFNLMHRGDHWDVSVYGIPIPQVDQMPVGLFSVFPLALKATRSGRARFTPAERARLELARYRCFLLGLPQELLVETPQAVVDIMLTRFATLRKGYDDNCSALVRATMTADLTLDPSWRGRLHAWMEGGFSKLFFFTRTMRGDKQAAAKVGVRVGLADYVAAATAGVVIATTMTSYAIATRIPGIRHSADRSLVRKLAGLMADYGHAEFTTNAANYRPAQT